MEQIERKLLKLTQRSHSETVGKFSIIYHMTWSLLLLIHVFGILADLEYFYKHSSYTQYTSYQKSSYTLHIES